MKSVMWKTTIREIRQSLGRYMAILAIVALGVGFFAGLKVTKPSMVETAGEYLDEKALYDFRLLSTYGFEQEDVEYFRERYGVRAAQGAVSFDAVYLDFEGNEKVIKAHSITDGVNGLELTAGRLPEREDECVVDSQLYGPDRIGEKICLAQSNRAEDLEHFACREYTIVGIVSSSYYIQFERGNTSLGTGTVSGFMYLLPEGFHSEYYTEIFVKLEKDFPLYSDAYEDYMEEKTAEWETYLDIALDRRYGEIVQQAQGELDEAQEEFDREKEDGWQQLEEARRELEDAEKEIGTGTLQMASARQELNWGESTLAEKEAQLAAAQTQLDEAKEQLAQKEAYLEDMERELEEGARLWQEQKDFVNAKRKELGEADAQFKGKYYELVRTIDGAGKKVEDFFGGWELPDLELPDVSGGDLFDRDVTGGNLFGRDVTGGNLFDRDVTGGNLFDRDVTEGGGLRPGRPENGFADRDQWEERFPDREGGGSGSSHETEGDWREALTSVREGWQSMKDLLLNWEERTDQFLDEIMWQGSLEDTVAVYMGYYNQLENAKRQLGSADNQLEGAWQTIESGRLEIADGRQQIRDGWQQLEDAQAQLDEGKAQLEDARRELEDSQGQVAQGEKKLLQGQKEYEEGQVQYQSALEEYESQIGQASRELGDAQEEIYQIERPQGYVLGRGTNIGYVCFQSDSSIVEDISNVFPVFFFLVAALVCITTMNRMVEEQRTQIGTLKALGYGQGVIMAKYMIYSGSAALIGCVSGFLGGTLLFPRVIWAAYGLMYRLPALTYVMDWKLAFISLAVSLLCSVGTTWLTCRVELAQVAAQLMRPKTPKAGKRVFLEYIPFFWKHLGFLKKVSVRNVLRYKKRFFMMVLGISGCTALVLTGFGIEDSIADVVVQQFEEISLYDMSISFREPLEKEDLEDFLQEAGDRAAGALRVMESSVDLHVSGEAKSVNLVVLDGDGPERAEFLDLHTAGGEAIPYPGPGEVVLTEKLASQYGLKEGDQVELMDSENRLIRATVSGVSQNFVYHYAYLSPETYVRELGEEPAFKSLWVNLSPETDAHLFSADWMGRSQVASVTLNQDTMERFSSMMRSLDVIVLVVILCAAGLAFIVLYNLTNINITERVREIATVKVLGFYRHETASYVFRENLILTFFGTGAGLLLGRLLHRFVMAQINIDMIAFDVRIRPVSYLYSVLLTFLFAWVVNRIMSVKLERISMTESLKSVD